MFQTSSHASLFRADIRNIVFGNCLIPIIKLIVCLYGLTYGNEDNETRTSGKWNKNKVACCQQNLFTPTGFPSLNFPEELFDRTDVQYQRTTIENMTDGTSITGSPSRGFLEFPQPYSKYHICAQPLVPSSSPT